MRIAIAGIGHESNSFTPLRTGLEQFHVRRGEQILQDPAWEEFRNQGVEFVPTLTASASPHGLVERDAYLQLKEELLQRLEETLPVAGVYLSLHGAMEVEEIGDGESDLVAAVRERVGPEPLISASLDLHGNIAPALVDVADLLTALRTAPHRDGAETRRRALSHLVRCLRSGIRPVSAMVKLPLLLPGEYAVTDAEPARSLYAMLPEIEAAPGLLDASLMIGCAWTDSPFNSVSVLVMAERDREWAQRHATGLAEAVWQQRHAFGPEVAMMPPEEAVSQALASPDRPVFISDSGDNVTAGGAGDLPLFVALLRAAGARDAVVAGIADAEAVRWCAAAGVGATVSLSIGGKLDAANGRPLAITGEVRRLVPAGQPELAVVQVEGVSVVLTTDRRAFTTRSSLEQAGIDPVEHAIIVVKLGYLFPELRLLAARSLMALSPGCTDLRLERLPYRRIHRPIYPLDRDVEWRVPPQA
jgi:microcystin degradation protein MlrC